MDQLPTLLAAAGLWGTTLIIMWRIMRERWLTERKDKEFFRNKLFEIIGHFDRQTTINEKLIEPIKEVAVNPPVDEFKEKLDKAVDDIQILMQSLRRGRDA